MAVPADVGTINSLPNFVGELFQVAPTETPLLSMIGGLTGGVPTNSPQFTWQTNDLPAAGQNVALEGNDPVATHTARDDVLNVCQIHQEAVRITYSKMAAVGDVSTSNANLRAGSSILGNQPVGDELDHQLKLKLLKVARDVEYSFIRGTFANPADGSVTARKTRGLIEAITTNSVAAGSTDLSRDHVQELLLKMSDSGAPFQNVVLLVGGLQKQRLSDIYALAPESRNVGGFNIRQIESDFAMVGVVYDRHVPADTILAVDVSLVRPRFMSIPGKGHFFMEPLARTGSSEKWQLYGEIGLEYGPEQFHGEITGLTTA